MTDDAIDPHVGITVGLGVFSKSRHRAAMIKGSRVPAEVTVHLPRLPHAVASGIGVSQVFHPQHQLKRKMLISVAQVDIEVLDRSLNPLHHDVPVDAERVR